MPIIKRMKVEFLISVLLCIGFSVFFQASTVYGGSGPVLSAWASVTPTIDGRLRGGEWDDADSLSFKTLKGADCIIYVKNDDTNIYLAMRTIDSTLSQGTTQFDSVWIIFDNDNDGFGPEDGDDSIAWNGYQSEGFRDGYYDANQHAGFPDITYGGTNDGSSAATGDGTYNFFEFSHPLDTDDNTHDFSLSLGDTVGFTVSIVIDGESSSYPLGVTADWLNIEVAGAPDETPTPPPDGTPTPPPDGTPTPPPDEDSPYDYTPVIVALIGLVGTVFTAYLTYRVAIAKKG